MDIIAKYLALKAKVTDTKGDDHQTSDYKAVWKEALEQAIPERKRKIGGESEITKKAIQWSEHQITEPKVENTE